MKDYFEAEETGRRPIVLIVGLVMTAIGSAFVISLGATYRATGTLPILPVLGIVALIAGFLGFGLFLLSKYIANTTTKLRVGPDGVNYGCLALPWGAISEFGVMKKYRGRTDLYCIERGSRTVVELLASNGLTDPQVESLFADLQKEVVPHHPEIEWVMCE